MYGGGFTFEGIKQETAEDPQMLAAFEARIDRGEKIEPSDWMPLGKQLSDMLVNGLKQNTK